MLRIQAGLGSEVAPPPFELPNVAQAKRIGSGGVLGGVEADGSDV